MARLYRPTVTRYLNPATGKRCRKDAPGAVRKTERSRTWRGEYRDADGVLRSKALARDKAAARMMLRELEVGADRGRAGLSDPFADHARTPLSAHVAAWAGHLADKGTTAGYVRTQSARVTAVLNGCGFKLPGDLSASRVSGFLADRRAGGMSPATSNHYLTASKGFTRWLVKDRRAGDDPLAHLSRVNASGDVRRERRALEPADLAGVLDAAAAGTARCGLSGAERSMLYRTAAFTGLRASELASLTRRSFDLAADPPTVTVEAAYSKRRRRDVLPVHPDLAARLAAWFDATERAERDRQTRERAAADPPVTLRIDATPDVTASDAPAVSLWRGKWASGKRAAEMLRGDLKDAGVPYLDDRGRRFDFHALRHQFITTLARSGVHPKDAQELARHSTITLTLDRYSHVGLRDADAAVGKLPVLPDAAAGRNRATGTDDADPVPADADRRGEPAGRGCRLVAGLVAGPGGDGRGESGTGGETSTGEHGPPRPAPRTKKPPAKQGVGDHRGPLGTVGDGAQAESGGFEPPVPVSRHTGLAIQPDRPLRQLSGSGPAASGSDRRRRAERYCGGQHAGGQGSGCGRPQGDCEVVRGRGRPVVGWHALAAAQWRPKTREVSPAAEWAWGAACSLPHGRTPPPMLTRLRFAALHSGVRACHPGSGTSRSPCAAGPRAPRTSPAHGVRPDFSPSRQNRSAQ